MNNLHVFEMNPNSYGSIVGIVTILFFLVILTIYTWVFERTKFMRNIIIFEILMLLYLTSFLFLVNAKTIESVFWLTRIYYTTLALHTLGTINIICSNFNKMKKFVRIYSTVMGIVFICMLYLSDQMILTREIVSYSFNIAKQGPYLYLGVLQNVFLAIYVLFDLFKRLKTNDLMIKKNWQFHVAYIIHASGIVIIGRLLEFGIIMTSPLYVNALLFNVLLMFYLILHIRQEVKVKEALNEDYIYDDLTRVHTREYIIEMLTEVIGGHSENRFVVMIDIDRFKAINDTYGHVIGDNVLKGFGDVINNIQQKGIYPGRIGGDEFIIVFEGYSKKEIQYKVRNIIAGYRKALLIAINNKNILSSGLSVGIAKIRRDDHVESVLEKADVAMYSAKRKGTNLIKYYAEIR